MLINAELVSGCVVGRMLPSVTPRHASTVGNTLDGRHLHVMETRRQLVQQRFLWIILNFPIVVIHHSLEPFVNTAGPNSQFLRHNVFLSS